MVSKHLILTGVHWTKKHGPHLTVLDNQQEDLKLPGKKDFLIVSAGTNDLNTPIANINNSIAPLITFVNKMDHTNVLVVNIPYRYDLGEDPVSIGV